MIKYEIFEDELYPFYSIIKRNKDISSYHTYNSAIYLSDEFICQHNQIMEQFWELRKILAKLHAESSRAGECNLIINEYLSRLE